MTVRTITSALSTALLAGCLGAESGTPQQPWTQSGADAGDPTSRDGGSTGFCAAGRGDCNANPGDGCETDLISSAQHCGVCGKDCGGGTCAGGYCQPVLLKADLAADNLALGSDAVYASSSKYSRVTRVPKDGSPSLELYWGQATPLSLFAGPDKLYFVAHGNYPSQGRVFSLPFTAGAQPTEVAGSQHEPFDVAADAQAVYWTNYGDGTTTPGDVMALPSGANSPSVLVADQVRPGGIALDSGFVYFARYGSSLGSPVDGAVVRAARSNGALTVLASNQKGPRFLALTATDVFWLDTGSSAQSYQDGEIWKVSKSGSGAPVRVAAQQREPMRLAVDAEHVYWSVDATKIWRAPLGGGAPEPFLDMAVRIVDLAVDDTAVYVATATEYLGDVYKIVK